MTEQEIIAMQARLASLEKDKKAAEDKAAELQAQVKSLTNEVTKNELPSFPVADDPDNDIKGGDYQFTSPTFTWDDNRVIDVRELVKQAIEEDKNETANAKALPILATLVQRKSGLIKRKED